MNKIKIFCVNCHHRKDIAEEICQAFDYLELGIKEFELIGLDK